MMTEAYVRQENEADFTERLREHIQVRARLTGFSAVGFVRTGPSRTQDLYDRWLAEGCGAQMSYLARNASLRSDPGRLESWTKSMIVLAARYPVSGKCGFSGYVSAMDYHLLLKEKLGILCDAIGAFCLEHDPDKVWSPGNLRFRSCVDSAPVAEREWAVRAGMGWIGKNGYLVNKSSGCCLLLCELLTNLDIGCESEPCVDRCGDCSLCVEACPTGALRSDRTVDARKCISYLTIEHRGEIDSELRPLIGDSLFGCDRCGAVCPWNDRGNPGVMKELVEKPAPIDALGCLRMDKTEFIERFKGTVVERSGLTVIRRNAAIVLGNTGGTAVVPELECAAADPDRIISSHAAWALNRIRERCVK